MALTTGKVRLSYVHVWQPQMPQSGQGDPKYGVTLLIPKSDVTTLNAIYAEMEAVKQAGIASTWGGVLPPIVKFPLYDGDGVRPNGEAFGEECKGHMVITASSKTQPQVVDLNIQPILNQADVYSGCYARVNINFFSYNQSGNKGVGCGLNCVQKVGDGEPLSGGVSAAEAFGGSNQYVASVAPTGYQQPVQGTPSYPAPQQMPQPYQASVPGMITNPVPQQAQQPMQPMTQPYAIDPITGRPAMAGIMGIG